MSAIAGVYLLNGDSVDKKDLKRMNDSMPHRGPDGSGLWHGGPVGLAHQMLWTTPESLHEKLPFEADGLVITSDSRIDNREELLPELGLSEEVSDSEVILKAYVRWGKSCVDRLLGDFAFVIWDKAKEEMFCARDHMGVRPFYYYYKPGEIFAFATEIKALFAWGVPREINEVRIGDYLARILEDKEITFYKNIIRLTPASIIMLKSENIRKEQYWKLDLKHEIHLESDEEYEKAFRDIFKEAVRCRLRSAFPVGSMLSGGLDSSSIVCVARELLPRDRLLKTFSIRFSTVKDCDEGIYINSVLKTGNQEAYFILGDKFGPLTSIEKILWHEDQPFFSFNLNLFWVLNKEAHNQNVRILLNGFGGDSIVSHGFAYITEMAIKGRLFFMLRETIGISKKFHHSFWRILLILSIYPLIPEPLSRLWRRLYGSENPYQDDFKIINKDFCNSISLINRKKKLHGWRSRPARTAKEDHWRDIVTGMNQRAMEDLSIASGAFAIEPLFPFFDKRLIEFCLALPADQLIRHGWTRCIMRRALKEVLPDIIYSRGGKSNLTPNFLHGLLAFNNACITSEINGRNETLDKYANIFELRNSYERLLSSTPKKLSNDHIKIWLAAILSLWLRSRES